MTLALILLTIAAGAFIGDLLESMADEWDDSRGRRAQALVRIVAHRRRPHR